MIIPFEFEEPCACWKTFPSGKHGCIALTGKCPGTMCSSYKTQEQADKENMMCRKRLVSLPVEQRIHISKKYGIRGIV